ncbi:MAG TPA: recombination mediator RecR [Armatimonadota bacterium]|nr:recombination mediator RecR [Armatimonadota bacterium]
MLNYAAPLARLIEELGRLPSIGPKSAQRLAFHLLRQPQERVEGLAEAILDAKRRIRACRQCFNYTDDELCPICSDARRDSSIICVVGQPQDLLAMERTREYNGVYHVLQGLLTPIDGIGPDDLRIRELVSRVRGGGVREVILATSPVIEGDATAMFIAGLLAGVEGLTVTRLASGLPAGGDLDYADEATVSKALEGRRPI